jgi:hypothetical protein
MRSLILTILLLPFAAEEASHVADDDLVITLSYRGQYRAYPSKIPDDGEVTMQRGVETHHPIRVFWFAWYTFHPGTDLIY